MHSGSSPACDTMYALQQQWLLSRRVVGFKMAGTQQLDIIVLEEGMGPADSNAELSDVMGINPGEMRSFHFQFMPPKAMVYRSTPCSLK